VSRVQTGIVEVEALGSRQHSIGAGETIMTGGSSEKL